MVTKRKTHFFDIYITKLLKNIFTKAEITHETRIQLNRLMQIFSHKIVDIVYILLSNQIKNTITISVIQNAVDMFLSGELQQNAREIANKVLYQKYTLILPYHITEKYLRKFGTSKYNVSRQSITYLTAVLEYLLGEILDLAFTYTKYQKRLRITVSDLEQSLREDVEFRPILLKYNIIFLNGNKVRDIPAQFHQTYRKIRKNGKLCHVSGGKSIKTIKQLQRRNDTILPVGPFRKMIHEIFQHKISDSFLTNFQKFIESFLEDILYKSQKISLHSNRNKLCQSDIQLLCDLYHINYENTEMVQNNRDEEHSINIQLELENSEIVEKNFNHLTIFDSEEISDVEK